MTSQTNKSWWQNKIVSQRRGNKAKTYETEGRRAVTEASAAREFREKWDLGHSTAEPAIQKRTAEHSASKPSKTSKTSKNKNLRRQSGRDGPGLTPEHLLLLSQKLSSVLSPHNSGSQLPATTAQGHLTPSSGLWSTSIHTHVDTNTQTQKQVL